MLQPLRLRHQTFLLDMAQGDGEKIRFAWGVKSLPWLILTDSQHVVSAEGFGLNELDGKIKEIIAEEQPGIRDRSDVDRAYVVEQESEPGELKESRYALE